MSGSNLMYELAQGNPGEGDAMNIANKISEFCNHKQFYQYDGQFMCICAIVRKLEDQS